MGALGDRGASQRSGEGREGRFGPKSWQNQALLVGKSALSGCCNAFSSRFSGRSAPICSREAEMTPRKAPISGYGHSFARRRRRLRSRGHTTQPRSHAVTQSWPNHTTHPRTHPAVQPPSRAATQPRSHPATRSWPHHVAAAKSTGSAPTLGGTHHAPHWLPGTTLPPGLQAPRCA